MSGYGYKTRSEYLEEITAREEQKSLLYKRDEHSQEGQPSKEFIEQHVGAEKPISEQDMKWEAFNKSSADFLEWADAKQEKDKKKDFIARMAQKYEETESEKTEQQRLYDKEYNTEDRER